MAAEDIYGPDLGSVKGKTVCRCGKRHNVHTIASIGAQALQRGHFDGGYHVRQSYSLLCLSFSEDQVWDH